MAASVQASLVVESAQKVFDDFFGLEPQLVRVLYLKNRTLTVSVSAAPVAQEVKKNEAALLENIFDSSLLDYFLGHGERTLAFSYTSNVSQHAILKDFDKKWSENIYAMYLKPSALDAPLRVEFLNNNGSLTKTADEVSSVVFALSGTHREYAYPSILVEADLRSRLTPQEIEVVFGKIFDKLSRHVKLKMRRDKRPF